MPEISVLMSVYNEPKLIISKSIWSILNQTFDDFEVCLILDNPDDKSLLNWLEKISKRDHRIRLIVNKKNIGLVASLNKAAVLAQGRYLARMDADDISHSDRFEKELKIIKDTTCSFVVSSASEIDLQGKLIGRRSVPRQGIISNAEILLKGNPLIHPTAMIDKACFRAIGAYRQIPSAEDYDLWARLLMIPNRNAFFIDEVLLDYRIRENGISVSNRMLMDVSSRVIKKGLASNKTRKDYESYVTFKRVQEQLDKQHYYTSSKRQRYNSGSEKYEFLVRRLKQSKTFFDRFKNAFKLVALLWQYPHVFRYLFEAANRRM